MGARGRPAQGDEGSLDGGEMGRLVSLDGRDGGDGNVPCGETGFEIVSRGELFQHLFVEFRLEPLEDGSKGFDGERFVSHIVASRTENRRGSLRTLMVPESVVRGSGKADTARGARREQLRDIMWRRAFFV